MLHLSDFDYHLPDHLIANEPCTQRDHCRLLVFKRLTGTWTHHRFDELPEILSQLNEPIAIVRNTSRVIPARLLGHKPTGGRVEVFLTKRLSTDSGRQVWRCLTKPGLKPGQTVLFTDSPLQAVCRQASGERERDLEFRATPEEFNDFVAKYGHTPIPPYIHTHLPENELRTAYQTVYADLPGSVAAPTAGLHFTTRLNQRLEKAGFEFIDVTLHVGIGTFLGVSTDNLADHHMHTESYHIDQANLDKLRQAIANGRKLLSIGTTSSRTLESLNQTIIDQSDEIHADTNIFLYPPAKFHFTDHLLTNFHLPRSTLLMLVAAFASAPNSSFAFSNWPLSPLGRAYQDAVAQGYHFFSFGDAMLII